VRPCLSGRDFKKQQHDVESRDKAIARLARLSDGRGDKNEANEWRKKLDQAKAEKKNL
jgi:hypothetical protein